MSNEIWVYIDHFKGQPLSASWECVGAARSLVEKLGGAVTALVFGHGIEAVAQAAVKYGADRVLVADDPVLADFRPEPFAALLAKSAAQSGPGIILFPTTTRGRELAAMAAIDLKAGILPDVIAMEVQDGNIVATRPVYAGKLLSKVVAQTTPQMITLRVRAFAGPKPDDARTGKIEALDASLAASAAKSEVVEYTQAEGGVSLTDAGVIVSGGRGVANNPKLQPPAGLDEKEQEIWKAQQGFMMLGELASLLNAAVGASRAAVDAGYVPYSHQVGQTGKVVSPDLYIAAGISGAIQHQAGMRSSKIIVAINKDPDAPIFKLARYGVVGDMYEIVPALTEALKKRLGA